MSTREKNGDIGENRISEENHVLIKEGVGTSTHDWP